MKFIHSSLSLAGFALAITASAQTNTFPASGNVGVGTVTPSVKLQVSGPVAIQGSAGYPTSGAGFEFAPSAAPGVDAIQSYNRDTPGWRELRLLGGALSFYTNGSERMRIDGAGNINVTGSIDNDANQFTFGTQGTSYGGGLFYTDSATDTLKFLINRNPASWLWVHNSSINAMRLDSAHQLILYDAAGSTAGVTLTPASNQLSLGSATLSGNGANLTVGGALTVTNGIANTTGALTSPTALNLTAGGTNQNITLAPSGTGYTILNGNVGIGTSTPTFKLDVLNNNYNAIRASGNSTNSVGIYVQNMTANGRQWALLSAGGGPAGGVGSFSIWDDSGGGNRFNITPAGNIGIGTTAPNEKLHINGAIQVSGASTGFATTTSTGMMDFANAGARLLSFGADNATYGKILFYSAKQNNVGGYYPMLIDSTGNVGVGTTTPNASLDIWKAYSAGTDSLRFSYNDGSAYWMGIQPYVVGAGNVGYKFRTNNVNTTVDALTISGDGKIGVGTLNPVGPVDIYANTNAVARSLFVRNANAGSGAYSIIELGNNSSNIAGEIFVNSSANTTYGDGTGGVFGLLANSGSMLLQTTAAKPVIITTNNAERVRVDSSGNVGLGTTAPTARLHVFTSTMTKAVFGRDDGAVPENSLVRINTAGASNYSAIGFDAAATPASGAAIWMQTNGNGLYLSGSATYANLVTTAPHMSVTPAGNVGIGTTNPTQKLSVNGTIRAKEIIVDTGWADYVFEDSYRLAPLAEVEQHIKAEKHLPGIPSAQEIAEHGVSMGDMQSKLLSKIEELTLHMIQQEKQMIAQQTAHEKEIASLRQQVGELKAAKTP